MPTSDSKGASAGVQMLPVGGHVSVAQSFFDQQLEKVVTESVNKAVADGLNVTGYQTRGALCGLRRRLTRVTHDSGLLSICSLPLSVSRYFCSRLRGLSGMVNSSNPASTSGFTRPSRNLVRFCRPTAFIIAIKGCS